MYLNSDSRPSPKIWTPINIVLALYSASVPFESQSSGHGSVVRYFGLALALTGALYLLTPGRRMEFKELFCLLAPGVIAFISILWSIDQEASISMAQTFLVLGFITYLAYATSNSYSLSWMMSGLLIGALIVSFGVFKSYTIRDTELNEFRATAYGANANDVAAILAVSSVLAFGWGIYRTVVWQRILLLSVSCILLISVVLTASRTAVFSCLIGILIIFIFVGTKKLHIWILIPFIIYGLWNETDRLDPRTFDRIVGATSALESGDFNYRLPIWKASINAWAADPTIGSGAGTAYLVLYKYLGFASAAHNSLLDILLSTGFLGLLSIFPLCWLFLSRVFDRTTQYHYIWIGVSLTLTVNMMMLSWDYRKLPWLVLTFVLLSHRFRLGSEPVNKRSYFNSISIQFPKKNPE